MPDAASASNVVAVVPVRGGELPAGGAEVAAESADVGGVVLLIGDGCAAASAALAGVCATVDIIEVPTFAVGSWSRLIVSYLTGPGGAEVPAGDSQRLLLPASPDGRDLAPRLAASLDRPLFAGVMTLERDTVTTIRHGGSTLAEHAVQGAMVITMQPGVRGLADLDGPAPQARVVAPDVGRGSGRAEVDSDVDRDAQVVEVLAPDVSTMDLSEAHRILGGGAGLDGARRFGQLSEVAAHLGASMGATRVITDRGWLEHNRQIGTTGVVVDPNLYLAFGISGAVQHTAGLGDPDHVVSINIDPHCPMMSHSDLAIVADANQTLDELQRLVVPGGATAGGARVAGERTAERSIDGPDAGRTADV